MANKLTSEGLTVGSSTLTNIAQDWGGGSIFCGLKLEDSLDTAEIVEALPAINVWEYKYCKVKSKVSGNNNTLTVTLPSGGLYQWKRGSFALLNSTGIDFYFGSTGAENGKDYGISAGGTTLYTFTFTSKDPTYGMGNWYDPMYYFVHYLRIS